MLTPLASIFGVRAATIASIFATAVSPLAKSTVVAEASAASASQPVTEAPELPFHTISSTAALIASTLD